MKEPVVVIGIGQMGGIFARGFLKMGHPVYPVVREMSVERASQELPEPALVLVAVAEGDLDDVLVQLPEKWVRRVGLLQNELLPRDWRRHNIEDPTVVAVWFEKKFRRPLTPLIPSPIYGPRAQLVAEALSALEIPVKILANFDELLQALVMKNLYILTANIAGLEGAETVGGLLEENRELTEAVFDDVLKLQQALSGSTFDRDEMWQQLQEIIRADPDHGSRGRSAPQRLQRALQQAQTEGLELNRLKAIRRSDRT